MKFYPNDTLETFEFAKVRELLEKHCRNSVSKKLALELKPYDNPEKIKLYLGQAAEFLNIFQNKAHFPSTLFPEAYREIEMLYISETVLEPVQFQNIWAVMDTINPIIRFLNEKKLEYPHLLKITSELRENKHVNELIESIFDKFWAVKSSASKELAEIRKKLSSKKQEADRVFRNNILKLRKLGWLGDFEESLYNGRRVVSIVSEHKNHFKGIIQGISDTGKTTFIEPIDTVEINNEVFELEEFEKREIFKILKKLSNDLRAYKVEIKNFYKALIWIDFSRAKAKLGEEMNAAYPVLLSKPGVKLVKAYHPLLYLQNKAIGKKTEPVDLSLNENQRIIIISGPNAGGKSISLKTLGLLQVMLQSGLLVSAAENSEFFFFRRVLTDIGDSQSLEEGLSTYSSRLIKMKYFLATADKNTLFLIDEFGTGSDPDLGGAIAEIILKEMVQKRAMGIVTTHFTNLKLLGENMPNLVNACMLFNQENLEPLYKLVVGQAGSSYTFEVAEKIGLPKEIIQRSKNLISKDKLNFNKIITELHHKKQESEQILKTLKAKEIEAENAIKKFEDVKNRLDEKEKKINSSRAEDQKLMEMGRKLKSVLDDINSKKTQEDVWKRLKQMALTDKIKSDAKKKVETKKRVTKEESERLLQLEKLKIGSKVKLFGSRQIGEVIDIIKDKIHINFGIITTIVTKDKIKEITA